MAVSHHAVRAGKSIPVPTWTHLQADKSIPLQKWTSLQCGQFHHTNAAVGHQMTAGGLQLSSLFAHRDCSTIMFIQVLVLTCIVATKHQ